MSSVFVSYRRLDSAGHAGRLVDHLRRAFPETRVFIDVDAIAPGADFVKAIEDNVAACDAVLALIGDDWLTITDEHGNQRLHDPNDFVRLELTAALKRNVPLIPVLVERAAMPTAAQLPAELAPLARINALEISDNRWDYDVGRLIASLESVGLTHRPATPAAGTTPGEGASVGKRRNRLGLALAVGLPAVVVAGIVALAIGSDGDPPATRDPLLVDVRTNLDDFDYTGIAHVPEFLTTRSISEVGPPPNVRVERGADTNTRGRWAWARQIGAFDASETLLRVTIQGRDDTPVIVQRVDVVVLERKPPPPGRNLSYTGLGSAVSPDSLHVQLDQDPPAVTYIDGSNNEQQSFTFSVSQTDVEVLNILAGTATCDCSWVVKLNYTFEGKPGELVLDDGGRPFRTVATTNAEHCHWTGSAWSCTKPG